MRRDVYKRPDKPATLERTRRRADWLNAPKEIKAGFDAPAEIPAPVIVNKATECHVTPPDVAARMVDYLDGCGDYSTLEPSAGTGNLVAAYLEAGGSPYELTCIERHCGLWGALRSRFQVDISGFNADFLEWAEEVRGRVVFSRVVMNPPFSKVRQHVAAALDLLHRDGHPEAVLVALVPVTFEHSEAETLETLPADTFATAKVNTKLIRIIR